MRKRAEHFYFSALFFPACNNKLQHGNTGNIPLALYPRSLYNRTPYSHIQFSFLASARLVTGLIVGG